MNQAPGEAVQKVCPRCSTLAYTGDGHCPWCGGSYKRRLWPALLGCWWCRRRSCSAASAYMLAVAADEVDRSSTRRSRGCERDLDRSFDEVRRSVREELDRRLPEP